PAAVVLPVMINPPFGCRAKAAMARSISSVATRVLIEVNSTPDDDAADWIAPHCPLPAGFAGSRSTATRFTPGAICLSNSSHFAANPDSNEVNPVALPPGRARLSTNPEPIGSGTCVNTNRYSPTFLLQRVCSLAGNRQRDIGCKCN